MLEAYGTGGTHGESATRPALRVRGGPVQSTWRIMFSGSSLLERRALLRDSDIRECWLRLHSAGSFIKGMTERNHREGSC